MSDTNTLKRWLNPKELFEEFGFTVNNQARLRMERKIPFSKVGKYIRYDRLEIDKWLSDNTVEIVC